MNTELAISLHIDKIISIIGRFFLPQIKSMKWMNIQSGSFEPLAPRPERHLLDNKTAISRHPTTRTTTVAANGTRTSRSNQPGNGKWAFLPPAGRICTGAIVAENNLILKLITFMTSVVLSFDNANDNDSNYYDKNCRNYRNNKV